MKISNTVTNRLKQHYGNWALITGATSGIGRELAMQLGAVGFNLVITGRREAELDSIRTELSENHQVEVLPIPGDLSKRKDVDQLLLDVADLKLGIVILNAGFGTSGLFGKTPLDQEINMLRLNAESLMIAAHHFINTFETKNRKGALVFLSSMVAFQGVPYTAHYAATKAYVQSLGEALSIELKGRNIDILNVAPGPVNTGFSGRADLNMTNAAPPAKIARNIIRAIGKKKTVFPDGMTKFLVYSMRTVPRSIKIRIMGTVMKKFTKHQTK